MVSIKQRTLRALRALRRANTYMFESGHVQNIHAGPYFAGIDLARGPDLTVVQNGTILPGLIGGYVRLGP